MFVNIFNLVTKIRMEINIFWGLEAWEAWKNGPPGKNCMHIANRLKYDTELIHELIQIKF